MSQFIYYSSSDAGGPGVLTGQAGTLIAVLKACLVDGYAGHAAAGWSQPVATAGNIGSFRMGAGTGFGFVLNDNGPNVTSTTKEAWITGWETIAGVGSPVGTGTGQFPTPAQLLVTGHGVVRKSFSADAVGRAWELWADSSTMILIIFTGDTANVCHAYYFGDLFSLKSTADNYRCAFIMNHQENTANAPAVGNQGLASAALAGHFIARTYGGGGTSVTASKHGDMAKSSATSFLGTLQAPNGPDNAYYMAPITVTEDVGVIVRGRLRGLYQISHPAATFAHGQAITGAGDYAGKSFTVIRDVRGAANAPLCVETSNTLESN